MTPIRFETNRILSRMLLALLPASALPLLVFGVYAISSHFKSLHEESLANHKTLVSFMRSQLEGDLQRLTWQIEKAAQNEIFRTPNQFQIRETLAATRAINPDIVAAFWLDGESNIIAMDPVRPELEGKAIPGAAFYGFNADNLAVTSVFSDSSGTPQTFAARRLKTKDGIVGGYLVFQAGFAGWRQTSRAILRGQKDMLAALLPTDSAGVPISIGDLSDDNWQKIDVIRSARPEGEELEINGEVYRLTSQELEKLPVRLVVAQPINSIYGAPRAVLFAYVAVIGLLVILLVVLVMLISRSIAEPVREVARAAGALAAGQLDVLAPVAGADETQLLARSFNEMSASIQASQRRMKVMYKSIMELFACTDVDALIKKTVELVCTQCQADAAWFLPKKTGQVINFDKQPLFVGLHGWQWKGHRSVVIEDREASAAWQRSDGDRLFPFTLKTTAKEAGMLRVAYRRNPDEATISLLHSLMALVETALVKQELIISGAMISTELDMAEAVQRNIMAVHEATPHSPRLSYFYKPASRLGGDWFCLIENKERDSLLVIIGDVTGHGLAQGLVTTAVKGALDVLEMLLERKEVVAVLDGPGTVMAYLDHVVRRVAGASELTMTCLAAEIDFRKGVMRVCNAGHTFPILVREKDAENVARHLHKGQQRVLGAGTVEESKLPFQSVEYNLEPGDSLIMYTDGLADARSLKSGIFGRFLFRSLKNPRGHSTATEMRDEILAMFNYYTQDVPIEDDVCFLVIKLPEAESGEAELPRGA